MQAPGEGFEEVAAVLGGTLLTSMVAELAGPTTNLRGTELAEAISHAAPVAGGEVFKEQTGLTAEARELAIAAITTATCKVVGAVCSRRRKLPNGPQDMDEDEDEQQEEGHVNDGQFDFAELEKQESSFKAAEESSPNTGEEVKTPNNTPARHALTPMQLSPISKGEPPEHSLEHMDLGMDTGQRRERADRASTEMLDNDQRRGEQWQQWMQASLSDKEDVQR